MNSTQSPDPSNYQILKRLEILEQRVEKIEKERKNQYNWIWWVLGGALLGWIWPSHC